MTIAFPTKNSIAASKERYRVAMLRHMLPSAVIATRLSPGSPECKGADRDIFHNSWKVLTDDPDQFKDTSIWIEFDRSVAYGNVRTTDDLLVEDLHTKKIIILNRLGVGFGAKPLSAQQCYNTSVHFDWFLRVRLSMKIHRNEQLEPDHREYMTNKLTNNPIDLLPIAARVSQFFNDVERGYFDLQTLARSYSKDPTKYLEWDRLADQFGVVSHSLSRSQLFRKLFSQNLRDLDTPAAHLLLPSIDNGGGFKENDGLGARTIVSHGAIWTLLYKLSCDGTLEQNRLLFDPFEGTSVKKLARKLGAVTTRTPTIWPEDFLRLLNMASKWVFEFGPHIVRAAKILRDEPYSANLNVAAVQRRELSKSTNDNRPTGAPLLYMGWHFNSKADLQGYEGHISVSAALKFLLAGSAIIIGCFSARRGGEVEALRAGCIDKVGDNLYEMSIYIEKTLRDIDRVPVPAVVANTISQLEDLVSQTFEVSSGTRLFKVPMKTSSNFIKSDITDIMQQLIEFEGLAAPEGKISWGLASHQLRRGFSILYFYGNDWKSLDSLTWILRHFDPDMTQIYVTEVLANEIGRLADMLEARKKVEASQRTPDDIKWIKTAMAALRDMEERKASFSVDRQEAYVHRMLSLHRRTDNAVGKGAKRLYSDLAAMVDLASADVRIMAQSNSEEAFEEALIERLFAFAAEHYLTPVPGGVAHCMATPGGSDDAATAVCVSLAAEGKAPWLKTSSDEPVKTPNFAFSGAYPCLKCPHCAAFKANQRVLQEKEELLKIASEMAATEASRDNSQAVYENFRDTYLNVLAVGSGA